MSEFVKIKGGIQDMQEKYDALKIAFDALKTHVETLKRDIKEARAAACCICPQCGHLFAAGTVGELNCAYCNWNRAEWLDAFYMERLDIIEALDKKAD